MIKCKCKGCEHRHPHCHKDCEDYAEFKKEVEKRNKARKQAVYDSAAIVSHTPHSTNKRWNNG